MRKARSNNNFIDKTFTIIADVLLRVFPASQQEKKSFFLLFKWFICSR